MLTIPNILTCIRLCLMPVFLTVYFSPLPEAKYISMGVLAFSFITDVLDGFIARRFNMISNLGKILDPAADKVMQITVLICIALSQRELLWVVVVLLIKELLMGAGAFIVFKRNKKVVSSNWFGKVSCFLSVAASLVLLFADIPKYVEFTCAVIIVAVNAAAFISYIAEYVKYLKKID